MIGVDFCLPIKAIIRFYKIWNFFLNLSPLFILGRHVLCSGLGHDLNIVGSEHLAVHTADQLGLLPTPAKKTTFSTLE